VTEDEFSLLLEEKAETARLDYKERFNWQDATNPEKGEIVKDILAFANCAGGGRIVFGVRDSDFEPLGITEEELQSFDQTKVNAFLRSYTDPVHTCTVHKVKYREKHFVVIEIPEFQSEPIICKKDLQTNDGKNVLQRGAIYLRKESAESATIQSQEEMRELLTRALKSKSDEILKSIQTILSGHVREADREIPLDDFVDQAMEVVNSKIGRIMEEANLGSMTVVLRPNLDMSTTFGSSLELQNRLRKSQITYRGWNFPHVQGNSENGASFVVKGGFASHTLWGRHAEAFCALRNGLFLWKSTLWEDSDWFPQYKPRTALSFVSFIYHTLEFILFGNSFYDVVEPKIDLLLRVELSGCEGRRLVSGEQSAHLFEDYICRIDRIEDATVEFNLAESIADPRPLSGAIAKRVFEYFGFQIKDDVLRLWQDKFLSRRF